MYAGELKDEQEMLEWLIKNQSSADDDDTIEETTEEKLEIMVRANEQKHRWDCALTALTDLPLLAQWP